MYPRRCISLIIVALVVTTLFGFSHAMAASDKGGSTGTPSTSNGNVLRYANANSSAIVASNAAASTGKKYIVFRDDDVFGATSVLKAINQVHITENVPVTLGIIPHKDTSKAGNELLTDPFYSYVKSIATNPLFEFAQHGYSHANYVKGGTSAPLVGAVPGVPPNVIAGERPYADESTYSGVVGGTSAPANSEFWGRPYSDQYNTIKQGRDDILQAFGVTPTTFIPPWNSGDDNTLNAANALGFKLYSTSQKDFNAREARLNGVMVQATSFYLGWSSNSTWQTGISDLTQQTDAALDAAPSGDHLVVYYHYWAFENSDGSLDSARLALFTQYIEHLKSRGDVEFTTLGGQKLREPTQLSLSLNNTNPAAGKPISFSGSLQTNEIPPVRLATVPVYLLGSNDSKNWRIANASSTTASGLYAASKSVSGGTYYFRTYYDGNSSYREAFSPTVKVTVAAASTARQPTQLSLLASNTNPSANRPITLSGILQASATTSTRLASQPIYLLMSKDNSNWQLASSSTASTDGSGIYGFTGSLAPGTYYFRTYYDGTTQYKEMFSPTVKVIVSASATRQPTKLSLSVSNANPTAGQVITFSGTLKTDTFTASRISNASAYLLVSGDNANWSIAQGPAATRTDGNGTVTFTQSRAAGTYFFKAYYDGNAQYKEAFSATTKVVVKAA